MNKARPFNTFTQVTSLNDNGTFLVGQMVAGELKFRQLTKAGFIAQFITNAGDAGFAGISTGIIKGGEITINTDTTKFDVAECVAVFVDNTILDAPVVTQITIDAQIGISVSDIASQPVTYLAYSVDGAIIQSGSPLTNEQTREFVQIGAVVHSNNTFINAVNNFQQSINQTTSQLQDLIRSIGSFNIDGNIFSANGSNLLLDKSAGNIFKLNSNFIVNPNNPHVTNIGLQTGLTFRYRLQNSTEYADRTTINPNAYDNAGVLTVVPNNKFTVQRIYVFQSGLVRIQYGQEVYNTLADATSALNTQDFVLESNIEQNSVFRAYLIVKQGTTNLSTATDAVFFEVPKFGLVASTGGGGATATTLQEAYEAGTDPEIITNSVRGAVSFKRGSGADTDNVVEFLNGVGAIKARIQGDGKANFEAIRFGLDTADANTLDDYEIGTYTPSFTFGGGTTGVTYAYRVGQYVKIGKLVTVCGFIILSNKGSASGDVAIVNLPFAGDVSGAYYYCGQIGWAVNFIDNSFKQIYSDGNLNRLYMRKGDGILQSSELTNTTELMFSITYKTQ